MKTFRYKALLRFLVFMFVGLLTLTGCSNEDEISNPIVKPFLSIDQSKYMPVVVDNSAQTVAIVVITNIDTNDIIIDSFGATWVTLANIHKDEDYVVTFYFNVEANETTEARGTVIEFRYNGIFASGGISQHSIETPKETN